ncbi:MAG: DNA polymerase I [Chloroflexi bacterium]|nr:DNA polymerase I [Chloroflexota bacterium]
MPPTLYLIDGHALAYRMYFALTGYSGASTRWQTSTGEPTAGIFGFARELLRIYEQEKPDYLAVAFDTGKTFRDEIYPEYKATRAKMPDDLRSQIERIRQMVDVFNIPRLEMEGFEADDVLGSTARWAAGQGLGVKIITGDRDLLQLVDERTIVYLAGDDQNYITSADVQGKLGVRPEQVVDYKAIVGDKSDNIPGVPGVGEKTAEALLAKFTTLDNIYAHLDEVEPRWRTKLEAGKDSAYMSRDLALIRTDLLVTLDLEQAKPDAYDPAKVEALFRELEFRSLVDKLHKLTGAPTDAPAGTQQLSLFGEVAAKKQGASSQKGVSKTVVPEAGSGSRSETAENPRPESALKTIIVDSPARLESLIKALNAASVISFDTETTSTDEMTAALVGISLAVKAGEGWYIPLGHRAGTQLPLEQVLSALRGPMTDARIPKIGHHLKYDFIMLARYGIRAAPLGFDTMLAEWVLDPNTRHLGLKNMASTRLGLEMTHIEDLIGTGKKQISMAEVGIESAAAYAAADAETVVRLQPVLEQELRRFPKLASLFAEIEMPLITVLADMEMAGIALDKDFFAAFSVQLTERLTAIEKDIYSAVGKSFNINSTQQLSDVLFGTLRLVPPNRGKKTASGHYSTAAGVLDEMSGQHPVVDMVLEYRELSKLKSTYVDTLPVQIHPETGRVHTSYSQSGAVTGRLSSTDPNLQNIPTRTELGRRVRRGFVAESGNVLLSVDYSQIELRIVAHMANDKAMIAAFRAGQDIHAATAAAIYGVPLAAVTKEQRRHAKSINFGLVYGMSAFGLTRTTELTLSESEDFVKAYFRQFPGVKKYLDGIRREAKEDCYVETLLGRRRYFPMLKSALNQVLKNREEREAINAPIQGTAADIMKIAMIRIPPALAEAGLHGRMLLQVHDELVLECPQAELQETIRVVRQVMENAYLLSIPLTTEARWGANWDEVHVVE